MFLVVGLLDGAAAVRFLNGAHHRIGEAVGIHDDAAVHIARRAADGLYQRRLRAQKALLVGVEDGYEGDFGKVEPLAQQVDAHQHVVFAQPQRADELDALQRFHIGVQVFHAHFQFAQVAGQALGHALGERRHQHAAALPRHLANFAQQVVHLIGGRADDDLRVEQARGADDLLHHLLGALHLVGPGRGGDVDGLRDALLKFMELQGTVVERRRQAEAVVHQRALAGGVAVVHGAYLRDGGVRFVDEEDEVLGKVIQQRERRFPGRAAVEVAGIVLDAGAVADLAQHFDVVARALFKALRFKQFSLGPEFVQTIVEVIFNVLDAALQFVARGGVVRSGKDHHVGEVAEHVAGDDLHLGDALDLVAKQFDAQGFFVGGSGDDLHHVAAHAEGTAFLLKVVALVLYLHKPAQKLVAVDDHALAQRDGETLVLLRVAQTIDAAYRSDDDHVAPLGQPRGGAVAHAVDLVVDGGVLFDEGVRGRDVRLGLVVVVIADEVAHGVFGEKLAEFPGQLRRQRLVVGDDQRRAAEVFDDVGHGEGLARAGDAQ